MQSFGSGLPSKPLSMPPKQLNKPAGPAYSQSIFINCPFDGQYKQLFEAAVFTVYYCGYWPRCALEVYDSGQVRIEKIFKLIEGCHFGIHDISRTELDTDSQLPRFNMPLELGMFLGAQRFGTGRQKTKNCLVFDREPYRYQKFMSDIAGQDIAAHAGDPATLITQIRDWLSAVARPNKQPGGQAIATHFEAFRKDVPDICAKLSLVPNELTFVDYGNVVGAWLTLPQFGP
jgi:hypothetical protein